MVLIGSHVNFGKNQLKGCVEQTLSYGGNTFMFYTGAPQNTQRSEINSDINADALKLMEGKIDINDVVCHAPYIINLANNKDKDKYKFAINFLAKEISRCHELGVKRLVLHPGSATGIEKDEAIKNIIYALNIALEEDEDVIVALETMAGKGSEIGINTQELKSIIDGIEKQELIGVCLDTCHLNDSGVDISLFDEYLDEFDRVIGLKKVQVVHINDSKNPIGSRKDRHELIGYGTIGFDNLIKVIYNERLAHIPKILETPYIGNNDEDKERLYPPYKFEIDEIKNKKFNVNLREDIRNFYIK